MRTLKGEFHFMIELKIISHMRTLKGEFHFMIELMFTELYFEAKRKVKQLDQTFTKSRHYYGVAFCVAPKKLKHYFFENPSKTYISKTNLFLKITNFAHFGFITLEFSDIFDPWATLFFQLPLTWNMCCLGVHNLHGPDFAVASIMECVFLGFVLPESWWKYPTRIYWSLYFRNIVKDHRIHFCICFSE